MIDFERGLYVVIKELPNGPHPLPLKSGFNGDTAYRVLGIYNPSESGECWLILANDGDQLWYISQRHVRVDSLDPNATHMRISRAPLPAAITAPVAPASLDMHVA